MLTRVHTPHRGILVLVVLAGVLLFMLSWGHQGARPAAANDPAVDFGITVVSGGTASGGAGCTTNTVLADGEEPDAKGEAVCNVATGGSFTVDARLKNPGGVTGVVTAVQMAVGWTPGLQGPGDPLSTKVVSVENCTGFGFGVTAAPGFGGPQTAAAGCVATPSPMTDGQATGAIGRFHLNCSGAPSQEFVTLITSKSGGTNVTDLTFTNFSETSGDEVITIECKEQTVGGFSVDLNGQQGGLPVETASSSGPGAGLLAGVIGTLTAAALALGGAGWYARRRAR